MLTVVLDWKRGVVNTTVLLGGATDVPSVRLSVAVDGGTPSAPQVVPVVNGAAQVNVTVPQPTPWSPATPNLHTIAVSLVGGSAATVIDQEVVRVGLRTVGVHNSRLTINGDAIKLHGCTCVSLCCLRLWLSGL